MNNDWTVSGQGIPSNIFIKAPDDDLNCIICYEVLYDPVQCKEGHSFCRSCISRYLERTSKCVMCSCNLTLDTLVPNRVVAGLIDKMEIRCLSCMDDHCRICTPETVPDETNSTKKRKLSDDASCASSSPTSTPSCEDLVPACSWVGKVSEWEQHKKSCVYVLAKAKEAEEQRRSNEGEKHKKLHLQLLAHAAQCDGDNCASRNCVKMKEFLQHNESCATSNCTVCKRCNKLLELHAQNCVSDQCRVPRCQAFKDKILNQFIVGDLQYLE